MKPLIRIVAFLLVPCLIADPVTASAWIDSPSHAVETPYTPVFDQQALSILATWWRNAKQPSAFRERREAGHSPAAAPHLQGLDLWPRSVGHLSMVSETHWENQDWFVKVPLTGLGERERDIYEEMKESPDLQALISDEWRANVLSRDDLRVIDALRSPMETWPANGLRTIGDSLDKFKSLDLNTFVGGMYLMTRGVPGISVKSHLAGVAKLRVQGPEVEKAILDAMDAIVHAISEFHRHGIAHRDLSPEEIFLHPGALGLEARLIDFGLSTTPRHTLSSLPEDLHGYHKRDYGKPHLQSKDRDIYAVLTIAKEYGRLIKDRRSAVRHWLLALDRVLVSASNEPPSELPDIELVRQYLEGVRPHIGHALDFEPPAPKRLEAEISAAIDRLQSIRSHAERARNQMNGVSPTPVNPPAAPGTAGTGDTETRGHGDETTEQLAVSPSHRISDSPGQEVQEPAAAPKKKGMSFLNSFKMLFLPFVVFGLLTAALPARAGQPPQGSTSYGYSFHRPPGKSFTSVELSVQGPGRNRRYQLDIEHRTLLVIDSETGPDPESREYRADTFPAEYNQALRELQTDAWAAYQEDDESGIGQDFARIAAGAEIAWADTVLVNGLSSVFSTDVVDAFAMAFIPAGVYFNALRIDTSASHSVIRMEVGSTGYVSIGGREKTFGNEAERVVFVLDREHHLLRRSDSRGIQDFAVAIDPVTYSGALAEMRSHAVDGETYAQGVNPDRFKIIHDDIDNELTRAGKRSTQPGPGTPRSTLVVALVAAAFGAIAHPETVTWLASFNWMTGGLWALVAGLSVGVIAMAAGRDVLDGLIQTNDRKLDELQHKLQSILPFDPQNPYLRTLINQLQTARPELARLRSQAVNPRNAAMRVQLLRRLQHDQQKLIENTEAEIQVRGYKFPGDPQKTESGVAAPKRDTLPKGKKIPEGSPYRILQILQSYMYGQLATPVEIQRFTAGRGKDGVLSIDTINRDLGTLIDLGLVESGTKWNGISYGIKVLGPDQWQDAHPIVQALGGRPTKKQKEEARKDLAGILLRHKDAAAPGKPTRRSPFDPREISMGIFWVNGLFAKLYDVVVELGGLVTWAWSHVFPASRFSSRQEWRPLQVLRRAA